MPDFRRKTETVKAIERTRGKPLADVIREEIVKQGSLTGAADALGVPVQTFYNWMIRFGISIRKVPVVERPGETGSGGRTDSDPTEETER